MYVIYGIRGTIAIVSKSETQAPAYRPEPNIVPYLPNHSIPLILLTAAANRAPIDMVIAMYGRTANPTRIPAMEANGILLKPSRIVHADRIIRGIKKKNTGLQL